MFACILYIVFCGLAAFPLGHLLRKHRYDPASLPFRAYTFEQDGKFYTRLGVAQWSRFLPDISRRAKGYMPQKILSRDIEKLDTFIQETCVAELVHMLLCVTGLLCIPLWPAGGGWVYLVYLFLGNLPYVIIQRHNRPRLLRLLRRIKIREDIST